jgi:hypothetical protein
LPKNRPREIKGKKVLASQVINSYSWSGIFGFWPLEREVAVSGQAWSFRRPFLGTVYVLKKHMLARRN